MTQRSQTSPFAACAARVLASLVVCGSVVGWSPAAAGVIGDQNNSVSTSTSSQTSFESPPACNPVGSSRSVLTITTEYAIGPGTIIIDNRDNLIQAPGGCVSNLISVPDDTVFSRCLNVAAGTSHVNVNSHTQTFQCVAAVVAAAPVPVPLLPWPALLLLGNLVAGLGVWQLARRRKTE